jgi:proline dehydrogenase
MQQRYIQNVLVILSFFLVNASQAMEHAKKEAHKGDETQKNSFVVTTKKYAVPILLTSAAVGGIVWVASRKDSSESSTAGSSKGGLTQSLVKYTGKKVIDKTLSTLLFVIPIAAFWRYQNGQAAQEVRKTTETIVKIHTDHAGEFKIVSNQVDDLTNQIEDSSDSIDSLNKDMQALTNKMIKHEKNSGLSFSFLSTLQTKMHNDICTVHLSVDKMETLLNGLLNTIALPVEFIQKISAFDKRLEALIVVSEDTDNVLLQIGEVIKKRNEKKITKRNAVSNEHVSTDQMLPVVDISKFRKKK